MVIKIYLLFNKIYKFSVIRPVAWIRPWVFEVGPLTHKNFLAIVHIRESITDNKPDGKIESITAVSIAQKISEQQNTYRGS
jgi:hypothetical protein